MCTRLAVIRPLFIRHPRHLNEHATTSICNQLCLSELPRLLLYTTLSYYPLLLVSIMSAEESTGPGVIPDCGPYWIVLGGSSPGIFQKLYVSIFHSFQLDQ